MRACNSRVLRRSEQTSKRVPEPPHAPEGRAEASATRTVALQWRASCREACLHLCHHSHARGAGINLQAQKTKRSCGLHTHVAANSKTLKGQRTQPQEYKTRLPTKTLLTEQRTHGRTAAARISKTLITKTLRTMRAVALALALTRAAAAAGDAGRRAWRRSRRRPSPSSRAHLCKRTRTA